MMHIRAKRFFGLALALVMMLSSALAESAVQMISFESYAQTLSADAQWESDGAEQIQILALDGEVTVSVCLTGENVAALTVEYPLGQTPENARRAIESLGWLNAETLDALLAQTGEEAQEMDGCSVYRVTGKHREAVSICRMEDAERMVWQPIHGGERIHNSPRCSNMDVSRMITEEAAAVLQWQSCGNCRKNG